jgi:hypothetical protein
VFAGYVAQVDFPGAAFWREICAAFPDALVVLSTRPAEAWYRSAASTIFQLDEDHTSSPFLDVWREWLGDRFDDRAAMVAAYERHYAAVRSSVPASRLLEWTVTDGWEPLCDRFRRAGARRAVPEDQQRRAVPRAQPARPVRAGLRFPESRRPTMMGR